MKDPNLDIAIWLFSIMIALAIGIGLGIQVPQPDCPPCEPVLWFDEESGELHLHWDGGELK